MTLVVAVLGSLLILASATGSGFVFLGRLPSLLGGNHDLLLREC